MDCLEAKEKLEPCARGELGAADRAALERHVATCEGCRLELELTRAVLGSSSVGAADEPSLADPVFAEGAPVTSPSFDPAPLEPSIQQERLPEPPDEGPAPPRVLTSQLPEEDEEALDLESLHSANAYDPGAIDLPHSPSFGEPGSAAPPVGSVPGETISFEDLVGDSPAPAGAAKAAPAAPVAGPGTSASWSFEPVDAPRTASPPEESLSFAKEALDRKRGKALREKRGARLLLWIGGAVGGVGLLGVSVWMALAFRDVPVGQDPSNLPAVQPPPGTQPGDPVPADSMASRDGASGLTATDSTPAPSVLQTGVAGSGTLPGTAPVPVKPSETTPKTGKPAVTPPPVAFRDDELAPAPRRKPQILTVEPDAPPGSEPAYEPEPDPAVSQEPAKSVSTAPIFVPPSNETRSSAETSTKQPEDAAPSGPIDRLHVATVTAEKNRDLEALRELKEPWKSLIRSTTGADRSRSKREYADCLWSIQEITSRDADRKEALAAYREYVLHAPAGGTDARTVSRMRHLEDILSDSR